MEGDKEIMTELRDIDLFHLKPIIKNFHCKLSAVTQYNISRQILCLVSNDNEIVFRYTNHSGAIVLKLISWFQRNHRVIHDISFDPTGSWLLVLCFDNTLHIVPALKVVDENQNISNGTYNINEITSFLIPFVGPHECPNSKACPVPIESSDSSTTSTNNTSSEKLSDFIFETEEVLDNDMVFIKTIDLHRKKHSDPHCEPSDADTNDVKPGKLRRSTLTKFLQAGKKSHKKDGNRRHSSGAKQEESDPGSDKTSSTAPETDNIRLETEQEPFRRSESCPFPMCAAWWQTLDKRNRAIIGYSDGAICIVALSPNCPFIANTQIEFGTVEKLLICRDNNQENVTLLITSCHRNQWKLLLEQKQIKYIYPGETMTNDSKTKVGKNHENWQFVVPVAEETGHTNLLHQENSHESPFLVPRTDMQTDVHTGMHSKNEEEILLPIEPSDFPIPDANDESRANNENSTSSYSQPKLNSSTSTTHIISSSSKSHKTKEDNNSGRNTWHGARSRLASLKNLGQEKMKNFAHLISSKSKQISYTREIEMPSFTIIDSPSAVPDVLTTVPGPYFTMQNLRNTFLLSALHSYSDTLSVHSMDISLIPLFLYKLPKNCVNILIGSNLLYAMQANDPNFPQLLDISGEITQCENEMCKLNIIDQGETPIENENTSDENPDKAATNTENLQPIEIPSPIDNFHANTVAVLSSAMASIRNGEETEFNVKSHLGSFNLLQEKIIDIHRSALYDIPEKCKREKGGSNDTLESEDIPKSPENYIRLQKKKSPDDPFNLYNEEIMRNEFPRINYDPCFVVTDQNIYIIELKESAHLIFLKAALDGVWTICEEFCHTFDLPFQACIEYAGDFLLRKKKITQALLTYNVARIPPVRTALKLAMFGENYALMHLCAMALKCIFILKSKHYSKPIIKVIAKDYQYKHVTNISEYLPKPADSNEMINEGKECSSFNYKVDEPINSQLSASSQFHLSNLLLITLAERAVKEKSFVPLWNFITLNTKFHTNMTSIVLCQSGLYSSAVLLALVRGAFIDVFVGLVSVTNQEFGWYSEINVLLYNLSDEVFAECLTYLHHISSDYLNAILSNLSKISQNVLERLQKQLNPFTPVVRPILMSHNIRAILKPKSSQSLPGVESQTDLNNLSKLFIETYLALILRLEESKRLQNNLLNAFTTFKIHHEDNQFAIDTSRFPAISVGCTHCSYVEDGCAYFWGSNGVPCVYSVTKSSDPPESPHVVKALDILLQLRLVVHAVKCGRQHSLILTNNGLYAFGSNNHGQLGTRKEMLMSLIPVLVEELDGKNITIVEAGQYHNAVVADNVLYTWGWGVYGQLGLGSSENVYVPTPVNFFKNKKVLQVSLGHVHSLVLCGVSEESTDLYVFGSNHTGQLGVGPNYHKSNNNLVKSLIPIKLEFKEGPIRLINTKFFSNLVLSTHNKLYTWGASPQALKMANQSKRRANTKHKIEESLRREIARRYEKQYSGSKSNDQESTSTVPIAVVKTLEEKEELHAIIKVTPSQENKNDTNEQKETHNPMENEEDDVEMEVRVEDLQKVKQFEIEVPEEIITQKVAAPSEEKKTEGESTDHLQPTLVNTSEVSGKIKQISCGLFHFALITTTSVLYTWGKNTEHQLGHDDKDRRVFNRPTPVEAIENPIHAECGVDFTIVQLRNNVLKAFGLNSNGQCGRDFGPSADKSKGGRLFCAATTKKFMRLEGNVVENPSEIIIPNVRKRSPETAKSNENEKSHEQEQKEPIRYLKSLPKFKTEYVHNSGPFQDVDYSLNSISSSADIIQKFCNCKSDVASSSDNMSLCNDEEPSSVLRNTSTTPVTNEKSDDEISVISSHPPSASPASSLLLSSSAENFRTYIHYCLYIFHGLYDSQKILNPIRNKNIEFSLRILLLNYKYVDAFKLCLEHECQNAQKSIKIFEYFTKDTSIIPIRREDLKFFIYELFNHFINENFDLVECETFFLSDLDYYLLELGHVLFFNNNNTEFEQDVKFKQLFSHHIQMKSDHEFVNTEKIFEKVSVNFKVNIIQRLLQVFKE